MATLSFRNIDKIYPNGVQAVFDFNLEVKDKEFICFVGPSGCGKSTTLRMIAGLEEISAGELYINDVLMNDVNPKDRGIAMVFQSYALYPQMTVYENMAFGLRLRKVSEEEIAERVARASDILGLEPYLERKPRELSGGQRQRVALGRAIVRDADVFLMDEPLSNLDAKLRASTRGEILKLHRRLESTTIYVTHDQIEAMTMADRIVIMRDGYIQQAGSPQEIYNTPVNMFVAGFMGTPPMNFVYGSVDAKGVFSTTDKKFTLEVPAGKVTALKKAGYIDKNIVLGIRPEDIHDQLSEPIMYETYPNAILDIVVDIPELLGSETNIHTIINGANLVASIPARSDIFMGSKLGLVFDMNKCHFFDVDTEQVILNK